MEEIQSAHHGKTDNLGDNDNKLCQCYAGVGNSTGGGWGQLRELTCLRGEKAHLGKQWGRVSLTRA